MRKAVVFALGSPLLIGSALAGGGGGASVDGGLIQEALTVVRMIVHALGLL